MGYLLTLFVVLVIAGVIAANVDRARLLVGGGAFSILGVLGTVFWMSAIVDSGYVMFPVLFGSVQMEAKGEGFKFINPLADAIHMDMRRYVYEFTTTDKENGGASIVAISADQNPLTVDVAFPFRLNQSMAWKVYQKIGDDRRYRQQLRSHARSAIRDAIAMYPWIEATTTKRDAVAKTMQDLFRRNVVRDLISLGFTDEEANKTFTFLDVQLRKILPDKRILNAIAEKLAANQDLEKQKTLTAIAEEVANRRANEGLGVAKLFGQLPEGFAPEQIATVLQALATKTRADAMLKAVETEQVDTIIMGEATPAVSAE